MSEKTSQASLVRWFWAAVLLFVFCQLSGWLGATRVLSSIEDEFVSSTGTPARFAEWVTGSITLAYMTLSSAVCFFGPIVFVSCGFMWFRNRHQTAYERLSQSPVKLGILIVCGIDLCLVSWTLQFAGVPAGASIRPMAWAALAMLVVLVGTTLGVLFSVRSFFRKGEWKLAIAGLLFSITPYMVSIGFLHLLAKLKGFHLSP